MSGLTNSLADQRPAEIVGDIDVKFFEMIYFAQTESVKKYFFKIRPQREVGKEVKCVFYISSQITMKIDKY